MLPEGICSSALVNGAGVEDDDVTLPQRRRELGFDPGVKGDTFAGLPTSFVPAASCAVDGDARPIERS